MLLHQIVYSIVLLICLFVYYLFFLQVNYNAIDLKCLICAWLTHHLLLFDELINDVLQLYFQETYKWLWFSRLLATCIKLNLEHTTKIVYYLFYHIWLTTFEMKRSMN